MKMEVSLIFKIAAVGILITILGQVLNALYFIICLFQFKTIKIKKEYFIPDVKVVGNIASLGTSSLISQIASVFVIAIMNNMLVKYGAVSKKDCPHLSGGGGALSALEPV